MEKSAPPHSGRGAESVTVPPLTEEEVRRFEDFFNSIDKIDITWNGTLMKLVLETCGP